MDVHLEPEGLEGPELDKKLGVGQAGEKGMNHGLVKIPQHHQSGKDPQDDAEGLPGDAPGKHPVCEAQQNKAEEEHPQGKEEKSAHCPIEVKGKVLNLLFPGYGTQGVAPSGQKGHPQPEEQNLFPQFFHRVPPFYCAPLFGEPTGGVIPPLGTSGGRPAPAPGRRRRPPPALARCGALQGSKPAGRVLALPKTKAGGGWAAGRFAPPGKGRAASPGRKGPPAQCGEFSRGCASESPNW